MKGLANIFQPQFPFKGIVAAMAQMGITPRTLFANNEPGVWYDPSDLSTLFQDSAGTTPVTAVEQPVGLMLDKSKGLGPELVTNGTFESDINGWIVATNYQASTAVEWSNGALHVYNTQDNYSESRSAAIPLTIGKRYVLEMEILAGTTASYWIIIGSSASNDRDGRIVVTSESRGTSPSGYKRWRYSFVASYATAYLYFATNKAAGSHLYADNISVREIPGNHASQPTATSRPVLSARVNLLTYSEQFDNAAWAKSYATVTQNVATAPDGTLTADKFLENNTNNAHQLWQVGVSFTAGTTYTASFFAKAAERSSIRALVGGAAVGFSKSIDFDLLAGTTSDPTSSSITHVGNGWHRCRITDTPTVTGLANGIPLTLRKDGFSAYQGDGTSGIYIWGHDLRVSNDGANLPPYQRVNTATDYDTAGFPHYLRFDGVDDWLVTNTITPGIDKAQVFAGVRRIANGGVPLELSAAVGANAGSFYVFAGDRGAAAGSNWTISSRGAAADNANQAVQTAAVYSAPLTSLLTGLFDIAGDSTLLRINGSQVGSATGDQGTGNYLAYPLYIGRRGGTTLPFNGHLYSLIVRFGANLPIAMIEKTEKYINQKTRAY